MYVFKSYTVPKIEGATRRKSIYNRTDPWNYFFQIVRQKSPLYRTLLDWISYHTGTIKYKKEKNKTKNPTCFTCFKKKKSNARTTIWQVPRQIKTKQLPSTSNSSSLKKQFSKQETVWDLSNIRSGCYNTLLTIKHKAIHRDKDRRNEFNIKTKIKSLF